jgi:hypothetical protein
MRFGNCYTYALARYRRDGGWLVLRRSAKTWVPHMQWGAAGLDTGAEPLPSWWAGFRRIMGPDRGYLIWNQTGCYWRARISAIAIVEYLPPEWCNRLVTRYWLFRTLPVHAIVFSGWVRSGDGEEHRTQSIIDQTWPGAED